MRPDPNDRSTFLGATDAASILGVSKWRTAVDVYLEKTGGLPQDTLAKMRRRSIVQKRGKILEPFIREMTIEKLRDDGHEVELIGTNERFQHKRYPFLMAEIDFRLRVDGEVINADAKSVNQHNRSEWGDVGSDDVPIYYAAQFMQGLSLTPGKPQRCLAAALRSFDDVSIYWTKRDEVTIDAMHERMVRFWKDHVQKRRPPDPINFGDIRGLFPVEKPASIEIDEETRGRVEKLRELEQRAKTIAEAIEHEKFWIARYMGDHALLTDGVRNVLQFETETRSRLDQKAFKRDHPDWFAMYVTETRTRVLRAAKGRA